MRLGPVIAGACIDDQRHAELDYRLRRAFHHVAHAGNHLLDRVLCHFEHQFVEGYLSDPQPPFAAVGSQWKFLTHPRNGTQVQHIFRYDAMPAFVGYLEARLGWPITLERENVSPDWPISLSAPLRTRLREQFSDDYALYEAALTRAPG